MIVPSSHRSLNAHMQTTARACPTIMHHPRPSSHRKPEIIKNDSQNPPKNESKITKILPNPSKIHPKSIPKRSSKPKKCQGSFFSLFFTFLRSPGPPWGTSFAPKCIQKTSMKNGKKHETFFFVFLWIFAHFWSYFLIILVFFFATTQKWPTCVSYWFLPYKSRVGPPEINPKIEPNSLQNRIPKQPDNHVPKKLVFSRFGAP